MEATVHAVITEEGTAGDDFNAERIWALPGNFAEVRRFPRADQRFERRFLRAAEDLDLKIATARGSDLVIGGATASGGARVLAVEDREAAPRLR